MIKLTKAVNWILAIIFLIGGTLIWMDWTETRNWKTYKNEDYGFSIKYPEGWEVYSKYTSYYVRKGSIFNVEFRNFSPEGLTPEELKELEGAHRVNISVYRGSVGEWMRDLTIIKKEEIIIDSVRGYKINDGLAAYIALPKNLYVYEISQSLPWECLFLRCHILNKMLSTFKFLE